MSEPQKQCQSEYDFTLVLSGINTITEEQENALFQTGCDDGTISIRRGRPYMTFSRTAESMGHAIISAIQNVRAANIGADVVRVEDCNLVTQAEIARRTERTRQQINQFVNGSRGPGGFPAPACEITEGAPLWFWCEVAYWMVENNLAKPRVLVEAREITIINSLLELASQRKIEPGLTEEFTQLLEIFKR